MADSGSDAERSEAATPKHREDALGEGRVPRSRELTIAVSLLASACVLTMAGPATGRSLMAIFAGSLTNVGSISLSGTSIVPMLRDLALRAAGAILPLLLALAAPTIAISAIQARGVWSITPIMPDFSRVS